MAPTVRRKTNRKQNVLAVARKPTKRPARKRGPRAQPPSPTFDGWRRLVLNPCEADLASPPYAGADAGYLLRTTDVYTPASGGLAVGAVGATVKVDFAVSFSPWNTSTTTGLIALGTSVGVSGTPIAVGLSNFITTSTAVREYRPVACCFKWIPTGATGTRSGSVASGYSPGLVMLPSGTVFSGQITSLAQRAVSNGCENHEVNWLPGPQDEVFTSTAATSSVGVGTVFFSFSSVDATYNTTTTATLNGYFEATVVWEWLPLAGSSLTIGLKSPSPYTTQQVLSTFKDLSSAVFNGVRMAGHAAALTGTVLRYSNGFLRNGMPLYLRRGPGM